MPLILPGNVASALGGGYEVANSCRFDRGSSAYMHKTPGSSGSQTTWTISAWVKRANEHGTNSYILDCGAGNGTSLYFGPAQIEFWDYQSGYTGRLTTNAVYRDHSAWYHIVAVWDTTNGTAGDRMKLYVNGTEVTSFATDTNPSSSQASILNSTTKITVGSQGTSIYANLYMAEVCFIDGQALTPSSFGEFNEDSPQIWQPNDVSELTFGTNGFYCDFEDSANLGNDANSGTDLTEVNLAATDQATDTPTNNFATWNPLADYYYAGSYAEGNCQTTTGSSEYGYLPATIGVSSGKWYCEIEWDAKSGGSGAGQIGITSSQASSATNQLGVNATDYAWYGPDGKIYNNNDGNTITSGNTYTTGDIVGIYLDLDNNKLYFSKNGTLENSGTGISITDPASTPLGFYFFAVCYPSGSYTGTYKANFGGCPAFAISSGNTDGEYGNFEYSTTITGDGASKTFKALCTKNLGSDGG